MTRRIEKFVRKISDTGNVTVTVLIIFLSVSTVAFSREQPHSSENAPEIQVNLHEDSDDFGTVFVAGISSDILKTLKAANPTQSQWRQMFAAYTGAKIPKEPDKKPAILGTYHIENEVIRFRPRFPLVKGLSYCVLFKLDLLYSLVNSPFQQPSQHILQTTFVLPKPPEIPTTVVTHVYPSTNEIPENLLKFYIYFSASMSRGYAYENIHLIDAKGVEIQAPFLELEQELWDANTQRLTLFFDPGRIKRGLRPNQDLGLALREGQTYRLVIKRNLRDADGNALAEEFQKTFTVVVADRTSPNYKKWDVISPTARTKAPLTIRFTEPLDHALLGRMLSVKNPLGNPIVGVIEISDEETRWQFIPEMTWVKGNYLIQVDTALEDLAGNKLSRLFDVDIQDPGNNFIDEKEIILRFNVKGKDSELSRHSEN